MYIVFEGVDGAGKTTVMKSVADRLKKEIPTFNPILTRHPGSTPLGRHINQLVKFPHDIDPEIEIDEYSRQLLYMVDTVSFIRTLLEPSLEKGIPVFADRSSFVSSLAYGTACNVDIHDLEKLAHIITPPKADRMYVLQCPWKVCKERLNNARDRKDHFESKDDAFFERVVDSYDNLITGSVDRTILLRRAVSVDNLIYVDSTRDLDKVIDYIVGDIVKLVQSGVIRL